MPHILLALILTLASPVAAWDPIGKEVVARTRESVVTVRTADNFCTGFIVGITRVVTAAHCLGEELRVNDLPARLIRSEGNLALLDTAIFNRPYLKIAKNNPSLGSAVASFGHAFGLDLLVYQRQVAGWDIKGSLYLDGVISPGMSGGPVVNSDGEVVGVNEATNMHIAYITGGNELRKFLKQ